MIKYVELTAPQANAYRQAKILSIECNEGDVITAGDTLFIVKSGKTKLELPSTESGKIIEFIVSEKQNITLSTPLLLLETEVDGSTATPPIGINDTGHKPTSVSKPPYQSSVKAPPQPEPAKQRRHEQQSLDLLVGLNETGSNENHNQKTNTPQRAIQHAEPSEPASTHASKVDTNENRSMPDSNLITISVPDIGADSAKVIEILVQVGDEIAAEDALVILESDKASMDVPCPKAGRVKSISVAIDQDVSEGTALIELELSESGAEPELKSPQNNSTQTTAAEKTAEEPVPEEISPAAASAQREIEVRIPDIGGDAAKVVEVLVSVGDTVEIEDALITLESDKASMEVPCSHAGEIQSISVKVDDEVSEGSLIVTLMASSEEGVGTVPAETDAKATAASPAPTPTPTKPASAIVQQESSGKQTASGPSHASPSIRRFARELGVDLSNVQGSGRKKRVTKDDVKSFVKGVMKQPATAQIASSGDVGQGIPQVPAQDFSKFGEIETQDLNKIKRLTATNLHRSWLNVPHVTHNDEANINDLEAFRKQLNAEYVKQKKDIKLSPLAFIVKAVVSALQTYPQFNSSLDPSGESLILKKYFHIGIAVDTANGLVVPVIRDADKKSVAQIAQEMGELAKKARDKKLTMNDMSGACFTISSLGGIGGTSFTPIVNAPEVAILGVSRSKIQPVWNGSEFTPGMMLPLSLSYDHRVIDGAEAARFARHIAMILEDLRRLTV